MGPHRKILRGEVVLHSSVSFFLLRSYIWIRPRLIVKSYQIRFTFRLSFQYRYSVSVMHRIINKLNPCISNNFYVPRPSCSRNGKTLLDSKRSARASLIHFRFGIPPPALIGSRASQVIGSQLSNITCTSFFAGGAAILLG